MRGVGVLVVMGAAVVGALVGEGEGKSSLEHSLG